MKWRSILLVCLLGTSLQLGTVNAAPPQSEVPPILLNGENGILDAIVYVGLGSENTSLPMMGTIPVRVCDGDDCEVYTANYMSDTEGYSMHRSITPRVEVGVRFGKRPVTIQVPKDLVNVSSGWSTASNAVTGWLDSSEWFKSRSSRPRLEVQFKGIDKSSITRADLCANYREGASLTTSIGGISSFDLSGYTAAAYTLTENGTRIRTEDLSSVIATMAGIPTCGDGTLGSSLMRNIDGLAAGKSYKLEYTISGPGKPTETATLDFVAPGACPSGEIILPKSPRAFYFGLLGTDGTLKSYYATGTYPWRYESIIGARLAPIYFSASKVGPYKGNLYGVRENKEKWRYVSDIDDWALVVEDAVPVTAANVLAYTVFADCTSTSLKPVLALNDKGLPSSEQACTIEGNEVIPTKVGRCMVTATVTTSNVSASAVRHQANSVDVSMNYVFDSVGTFTKTVAAPSPSTSKVKRCSIVLSKTRRTATSKQLLSCAGLKKKSGQTSAIKISATSKKTCAVRGTSIVRTKKGTCSATIQLKKGKKVVSSRMVSIKVS